MWKWLKPYKQIRILFLKFSLNLVSTSGFRFQIDEIDLSEIQIYIKFYPL